MKLPQDLHTKVAVCFFLFAIVLLIAYQISFVIQPVGGGFFESDNYEYFLFAQTALSQHSFNISNNYLVSSRLGFFEAHGLYQLPVLLHYILPVPLIWDFRIIYVSFIAGMYALVLLLTRKILCNTYLNKAYCYVAYALVSLNYLLLQQTEIVEWRGSLFITFIMLAIVVILSYLWLGQNSNMKKKAFSLICSLCLIIFAFYMWNAWYISIVPLILIPAYEIYKRVQGNKIHWLMAFVCVALAIGLFVFPSQIDQSIIFVLQHTTEQLKLSPLNCYYNPLSLGEVGCINASNGLYTIVLYLLFFAFMVRVFLNKNIFSFGNEKYDYLVFSIFIMTMALLPFALVYIRLLQLLAPYLAIGFSLGLVGLLARGGASGWVNALVVALIFISSVFSFALFWQTTSYVFHLDNPPGLLHVSEYLNSTAPNSITLGFYGWGGQLEDIGHQKVYEDTIQLLDYNVIIPTDNFYSANQLNCTFISDLKPRPDYIVTSNTLSLFQILANDSKSSLVKNPTALSTCGLAEIYSDNGFYVFRN